MANEQANLAFDADIAVTLYPEDGIPEEHPYIRWSGWSRRNWPLKHIAPGLRLYGFDTKTRSLRILLEASRAGWFEYTSWRSFAAHVRKILGESPDPNSLHRDRMPFGEPGSPCYGYAIECKAISEVSIPWPIRRVPPIGWFKLREVIAPPESDDLGELPRRANATVSRIVRDTALSNRLKGIHDHRCQLCGDTLTLNNGTKYSEAHHLKPLGKPHEGPDVPGNILVVCPNCHALCDLGGIRIKHSLLQLTDGHEVDKEFISYHNDRILTGGRSRR